MANVGFGQKKKLINAPIFLQDYDNRLVHFGYYLGPHVARYNLKFNKEFDTNGTKQNPYENITSPPNLGWWRFGGSVNYYISEYFDFKTALGASLYTRAINYYDNSKAQVDVDKEESKAWIEIPFYLKFKSERRQNKRMYMLTGFRYAAEVGAVTKRGRRNVGIVAKKKQDFCFEYGVGIENFTPYAKITPELLFSHGLSNLLSPSSSVNQLGLSRISSNTVTLFFYFE